jgi:hypothetical protein
MTNHTTQEEESTVYRNKEGVTITRYEARPFIVCAYCGQEVNE